MMISENIIGDMEVSLLATMHSWLKTSLKKKKKVDKMFPPPFDVISSFLQKPPKVKKTKVISKLVVDKKLGNLCIEISKPIIEKNVVESSKLDFILDKVDLGPSTVESDFHNFEVTTAQMLKRDKKEKRSKEKLKEKV